MSKVIKHFTSNVEIIEAALQDRKAKMYCGFKRYPIHEWNGNEPTCKRCADKVKSFDINHYILNIEYKKILEW